MKQYDFNEIQKMQEKALERVKNMQIRARQAVENENGEMPEEKGRGSTNYITADSLKPYIGNGSVDHIQLPVNLPKKTEIQHKEPEAANDSDLFSQPDRALLFSLLMLLKSNEASEELIMALLYIML